MLTENDAVLRLSHLRPAYEKTWKDYLRDREYGAETWVVWIDCAHLFIDRLLNGECEEFEDLKNLLEEFQTKGDDSVRTVVKTGFLESIVHSLDGQPCDTRKILSQLGPISREYINAYNKYHGVMDQY